MTKPINNAIDNAVYEIQRLRQQNEILSAKVEVMELFGLVFRSSPNYVTQGYSEDVAHVLQRFRVEDSEQDKSSQPPHR